MIPLPDKQYGIIYADPPWFYQQQMKGTVGKKWDQGPHKHYEMMPTPDISALPIADIADTDCLLFLWVTNSHLEDGLAVGKAWGFKYKSVAFVWDKQRRTPGYYTMGQCELCLVFKRGKIPQPRGKRNIHQFLSELRREHSKKPDVIRQRIIEMFPHHDRIELFARDNYPGWDTWGTNVNAIFRLLFDDSGHLRRCCRCRNTDRHCCGNRPLYRRARTLTPFPTRFTGMDRP